MNKSNKFSPEVRGRAVRLVQEHLEEYPSLWAAVESMAPKIGRVPQTLLLETLGDVYKHDATARAEVERPATAAASSLYTFDASRFKAQFLRLTVMYQLVHNGLTHTGEHK